LLSRFGCRTLCRRVEIGAEANNGDPNEGEENSGRVGGEGEGKMREIRSKNPLSEAVRREREEEWNS
jgi:hypothetical protein